MRFALLLVSALVITIAASASAGTRIAHLSGVVVGNQHGVLLVASPSGDVHAYRGHEAVGTRVSVTGGTIVTLGRASRTLVRGIVVRQRGSLSFLSAGGHMLVLHTARHVASARDIGPAPGTFVQDTVSIGSQGELDEQDEQPLGDATQAQIQAVVTAVAPGSVTLTVNGQDITIPLPAGLTLPATVVGSTVTLNLSFGTGQAQVQGNGGDDGSGGGGNPGTGTFGAKSPVSLGGHAGLKGGLGGGGGDDGGGSGSGSD